MFTTSFVPPLPLWVSVGFFWRPSYTYHVPFSLKKLTAHLKRGWSCCFYQVTKVQPSKLRKLIYGPSLKFDLRTSVPLKKKRCKIGSNTGLLHAVPSCQVSLSLIWNLPHENCLRDIISKYSPGWSSTWEPRASVPPHAGITGVQHHAPLGSEFWKNIPWLSFPATSWLTSGYALWSRFYVGVM